MKKEQQMTMGVLTFLKTDNLEASKDLGLVNLYTNKGECSKVILSSLPEKSRQEFELNKYVAGVVSGVRLALDFEKLEIAITREVEEEMEKIDKELLAFEITPQTSRAEIIEKLQNEGINVNGSYSIILNSHKSNQLVDLLIKKENLRYKKNQFYTLNNLQKNGFVETNYYLWGSLSGRIISYNPSIQNLPSIYKDYILPSNEGDIVYELDIKCAEIVALAYLSKEEKIFSLLEKKEDIYSFISKELFVDKVSEISEEKRKLIKSVTNGIFLGMGGMGIANEFNKKEFVKKKLSQEQGTDIREKILKLFPNIKNYLEDIMKKDTLETALGHKIKVNPSYKNSSFPAQNTIATIIKSVLLELDEKNFKQYIINVVHDSIWISVPNEVVKNKIKDVLKDNFDAMLLDEFKNKDINLIKETKIGVCL